MSEGDATAGARQFRYDAFISYSRKDKAFAHVLEKALENYKPPRDLNLPQRRLEVFRDEEDLTGVEYHKSVERFLDDCSALIVLCSPSARASTYVDQEIRRFAATHDAARIIPVLVNGIPNNEVTRDRENEAAFPEALCELLQMPLAHVYRDFRIGRDRVHKGVFHDAWHALLANLYGIPRSDLEQREKRRQAIRRRYIGGTALAIIALLSAALIFALISRREAIEQRGIAQDREQDALREKERAEKAAEAERLAAIAARRETASRLAVQAVEALDGGPEKSLGLAMRAVETFLGPGDPLVPEALGALQKSVAAMLGSRPLVPWSDQHTSPVFSGDHRWVAVVNRDGTLQAGRAGTGNLQRLSVPARVNGRPPKWASSVKLAFSPAGLLALRSYQADSARWHAAALLWPMQPRGLRSAARLLGTHELESESASTISSTPDGRWVSWSDGYRKTFLRALEADATTLEWECDCTGAFSDNGESFFLAGRDSVRRFALPNVGNAPAELPALDSVGFEVRGVATLSRGQRLALLGTNGEILWWDLAASPPARHSVPNVFSAYETQLQVHRLERGDVRSSIEFGADGEELLVTMIEAEEGEFGITAVLALDSARWQPLLHRHQGRFLEGTSRVSGEVGGAIAGYNVTRADELGVASAIWVAPGGVVTVGQDGTVLFWRTDRNASQFISGGATLARVAGNWLVTGGVDGKVRIWDMNEDEREPVLVLNGHDAPIRDLSITPAHNRIVSIDSTGVSRLWDLEHPGLNPGQYSAMSPDGRWILATQPPDRFIVWDLQKVADLEPAAPIAALNTASAFGVDPRSNWMVTLHHPEQSPGNLTLRLWNLDGVSAKPVVERRWPLGTLDRFWNWSPRMTLSVTAAEARITFSGSSLGKSQLWSADLRSEQKPIALLANDERLVQVVPGLAWSLTSTSMAGSPPRNRMQLRSLDDAGKPTVPLARIGSSGYVTDVSPDHRWLLLSGDSRRYLLDFGGGQNLTSPPRWHDAGSAFDVAFARGRPPLWINDDGRLTGLFEKNGVAAVTHVAVGRTEWSAVSWDTAGTMLGLADNQRHVWVVPRPDAESADTLRQQIVAVMKTSGLPMPADTAVSGGIERLFLLPGAGWIAASTEDDTLLLWHRGSGGSWNPPLVFTARELRLDFISEVEVGTDGRWLRLGNSEATATLSLDPEALLVTARRLQSGRVH